MKTPAEIAAEVLGEGREWPTPFRTGSDLIDAELRGLIVAAVEADRAQRITEAVNLDAADRMLAEWRDADDQRGFATVNWQLIRGNYAALLDAVREAVPA